MVGMVAKMNVDYEEFKRLYAQGLSDREIGRALGFSRNISVRVRSELSLAPNHKPHKKVDVDDLEEFKRLHAKGMIDGEIAEALGFSLPTARKIRIKMGLPPQTKLTRLFKTDKTEFFNHYQQGKSTKEIASELQVTYKYMYLWVKKYTYKAKRTKYVRRAWPLLIQKQLKWIKKHKNRLELYNKGLSDTQIAAQLDEKKDTIKNWRRENNLPLPSKIDETEFIKHFQQGKSIEEIASQLRVNHSYLCKWMGRHNYNFDRRKHARKTITPDQQQHKNKLLHPAKPGDMKNEVFVRMTFSFPNNFLDEFNKFLKIGDYSTSEAIRAAMRRYVFDYEQTADIEGHHVGTALIVYKHTKHGLSDALVNIQHQYSHLIKFSVPIYFGLGGCLEIVVLDGDGEELKELSKAIKILKGVNLSEFSTVSLADRARPSHK